MPPATGKAGLLHGRKYECGVPADACSGTLKAVLKRPRKIHGTPEEAHRCLVRYYYQQGYTRGPNHEMLPPPGSDLPIQLLPKKSKMTALRPGKETRWMPEYNAEIVNC